MDVERSPKPPWTPPAWLNRLLTAMLHTPLLQRLVGRSTALITFTGRNTGRRYTTPVTYHREGDTVIITAHESRTWWRNLVTEPKVELRLAGRVFAGRARPHVGDRTAIPLLATFFEHRRIDAKFSDVGFDADGRADREQVRTASDHTVVVEITLDDTAP